MPSDFERTVLEESGTPNLFGFAKRVGQAIRRAWPSATTEIFLLVANEDGIDVCTTWGLVRTSERLWALFPNASVTLIGPCAEMHPNAHTGCRHYRAHRAPLLR